MNINDDELAEVRENLRATGVPFSEDGRVEPLSVLLDKIAQDGGGVIDQETAVAWSHRARVAEDTLVDVSRDVSNFDRGLGALTVSAISAMGVRLFTTHLITHLSKGVSQAIYGLTEAQLRDALSPLLKKEPEAEAEKPDPESFDEYRVEYNLLLDLGVTSGWERSDYVPADWTDAVGYVDSMLDTKDVQYRIVGRKVADDLATEWEVVG